ncbi:MAG TPA: helix-hairpin-helix domain-containing protein [Verrucomicrobiae bacterium]|nr:helix-hairpin-helix domain-containing protein [Verrucomicrobiae bacterium]
MKTRAANLKERASALIIVLWIGFGLVALSLYFGQSMSFELRASENAAAALEADQAIQGAARYVTNVLARVTERGSIPETNTYRCSDVYIGDARVWFIGRNDRQNHGQYAAWGLVDEGSKLPLNVVTYDMLSYLPRMTPEIAASIIDWRDGNDEVTESGVESDWYLRQNPAYYAKNTNYDSVGELRLVAGMDLDLLFGEDANLNGILDRNENDSDTAMPFDNRDGRLDPGFMEYFTVSTRIPTVGTNINDRQQISALIEEKLGASRVAQLTLTPPPNAQNNNQAAGINTPAQWGSLLEFYVSSGLTRDEMRQIEGNLVCTNATNALININTASQEVLACIPGIGVELAPQVVAYRQSNSGQNSIAWLPEALGWNAQEHMTNIRQVGPWISGRSFQFSADIAAVGRHGRGYKRVKYVFDVADGYAQTKMRQDLTYLGWALGRDVRNSLLLASNKR